MSRGGTTVNVLFTIALAAITPVGMMLVSLALAAIAQAPTGPVSVRIPPRATVRIVHGARVHLGPSSTARMVKASVRVEDGQRRFAYLIEFQ